MADVLCFLFSHSAVGSTCELRLCNVQCVVCVYAVLCFAFVSFCFVSFYERLAKVEHCCTVIQVKKPTCRQKNKNKFLNHKSAIYHFCTHLCTHTFPIGIVSMHVARKPFPTLSIRTRKNTTRSTHVGEWLFFHVSNVQQT